MATQQDALVSLEGSAKVGAAATLNDIVAQGHVIDIEVQIALASGMYEGMVAGVAGPLVKQVLAQLAAKLAAPTVVS